MSDPTPRDRLARLIRPLPVDGPFLKQWRVGAVEGDAEGLKVTLDHPTYGPVALEIARASGAPAFARTNHFEVRHGAGGLTERQQDAVRTLVRAILANGM